MTEDTHRHLGTYFYVTLYLLWCIIGICIILNYQNTYTTTTIINSQMYNKKNYMLAKKLLFNKNVTS